MNMLTSSIVWVMISIVALAMTIVSILALVCAAVIVGAVYCTLYLIGAASVLVVSVYVWWHSLLTKIINLDND